MVNCSACRDPVLVTQKRIKCTNARCTQSYHHECVKYIDDSSASRSKWICPSCVAARPKGGDNSNTPVQGRVQKSTEHKDIPIPVVSLPSSLSSQSKTDSGHENGNPKCTMFTLEDVKELLRTEMSSIREDLATVKNFIQNEFGPLKVQVQELKDAVSDFGIWKTQLQQLEESVKEFKPLKAKVLELQESVIPLKAQSQELGESVAFVDAKYDDLIKKVEILEKKVGTIGSSKTDMKEVKSTIAKIDWELNSKEQWARRSNIEIQGIPEAKNENLLQVLTKITQLAGFPINVNTDIDFITRVAHMESGTKKPKSIIVRFLARYKKDDCLAHFRKLRDFKACDVGFTGNNSSIYFNDHLTRTNKLLLKDAKKLATERGYKWVWVRHCCIMVRQSDTSKVLNILNSGDLKDIK